MLLARRRRDFSSMLQRGTGRGSTSIRASMWEICSRSRVFESCVPYLWLTFSTVCHTPLANALLRGFLYQLRRLPSQGPELLASKSPRKLWEMACRGAHWQVLCRMEPAPTKSCLMFESHRVCVVSYVGAEGNLSLPFVFPPRRSAAKVMVHLYNSVRGWANLIFPSYQNGSNLQTKLVEHPSRQ